MVTCRCVWNRVDRNWDGKPFHWIDYLSTTYVMGVEGGDPNLEASSTKIYHSTLWGYSQQNSYSGKLTFLQQIKSK